MYIYMDDITVYICMYTYMYVYTTIWNFCDNSDILVSHT